MCSLVNLMWFWMFSNCNRSRIIYLPHAAAAHLSGEAAVLRVAVVEGGVGVAGAGRGLEVLPVHPRHPAHGVGRGDGTSGLLTGFWRLLLITFRSVGE